MINNEFSKYHPVTNLIYFILCFVSVFYINNPFVIFILLIVTVMNNIISDKGKKLRSNAVFYIIISAAIFLVNPVFVNRGIIILFYMLGNPVTLESVVFGLKSALSLFTVLIMFNAFNIIINPEKFIYLFSRIFEQTAFVIMLGLRFIPTLRRRIAEISDISRVGTRHAVSEQTIPSKFTRTRRAVSLQKKIKNAMNIILTLITWSLEDAVVTAQSMRSRGYGVNIKSKNGRTFYFIYKFTKRDALFIFFNITSFVLFLFTFMRYDVNFQIYPTFSSSVLIFNFEFFINLGSLIVLFSLPIIIEITNRIKWSFIYNADNRI